MGFLARAILGLAFAYFVRTYYRLYVNIQAAKKTGIPYIVAPFHQSNIIGRIVMPKLVQYLVKLKMTQWARYMVISWQYFEGYDAFEKNGELFLTVTPGQTVAHVGNAALSHQITMRRSGFPKPTQEYTILELYGKNVLTTEGNDWRAHRRITGQPFNDKVNAVVWAESLNQVNETIRSWNLPHRRVRNLDGSFSQVVTTSPEDAMMVSLAVISKAGFDIELEWSDSDKRLSLRKLANGHTLSFQESIQNTLHSILALLVIPHWLLRYSPFPAMRRIIRAKDEFNQYMEEMFNSKQKAITQGDGSNHVDLMYALINNMAGDASKVSSISEKESHRGLSRQEIIGNTFIFLIAGHETTANALTYATALLATYPEFQRELQRELDEVIGDKPRANWDYKEMLPILEEGYTAAIMNETLRLYPPVIAIPKMTADQPMEIAADGKHYQIPPEHLVQLHTCAIHRSPKTWLKPGYPEHDVTAFRPTRWFVSEEARLRSEKHPKGAPRLIKPEPGSWIPFSEGYRGCLGTRFAITEVLVVLAGLLKDYSLELYVDEAAGETWEEVDERALRMIGTSESLLTLQMKDVLPFTLVKRGEERWAHKSCGNKPIPHKRW